MKGENEEEGEDEERGREREGRESVRRRERIIFGTHCHLYFVITYIRYHDHNL